MNKQKPFIKAENLHGDFSIDLKRLIFFVTSRCNAKCSHCFYWKDLNKKEELSLAEIKRIADKIGKLKQIFISGGEPFLRQDLIQICEYFVDKCKVEEIAVPTNGTLDRQVIDFVRYMSKRCKIKIHVSLDGLKETHNRIRGIECFDKAISLLKKLKDLKRDCKFKFNAVIVVSNKNLNEVVELGKLLDSIDVNMSMTPIRGLPKDAKLKAPTAKEWDSLTKELQKNTKAFSNGIFSFITIMSKKRMYMNALKGKRKFVCMAGSEVGVIEYNGEVRLCELTEKIGNVKDNDYDFYKVWNSKKAEDLKKKIKECVCTHTCFIEPKIIWMLKKIRI